MINEALEFESLDKNGRSVVMHSVKLFQYYHSHLGRS